MDGEGESPPGVVSRERLEAVKSAFLRGANTYGDLGSPLYRALMSAAADDPDIVALASHAQPGAQPAFHLLACVHFLLLRDAGDPLARFFATLTDPPAPPEQAFPHLVRYCAAHRDEILHELRTRTVQTTYLERCGFLLPLISAVANWAGEPLNLIEVGCSAAILLTLDKHAYELPDGEIIGPPDAPLTIKCEMHGGPRPRIPAIARRIGLDLHPIDVRSEVQRRWLVALSIPELITQRERLMAALDVVAATDIRLLEGDGLGLIADVLAETPGPVCVFHSACLTYWPEEARAAFDERLMQASRGRDIYRVGIEGSANFRAWHQGQATDRAQPQAGVGATSELSIARYREGQVESTIVGHGPIFGPFEWVEDPAWA